MILAKILVIDDETILRTEMMDWLTFEGYEVMGVENGLAGVKEAAQWLPDLIVCDVTMPYLDGFGVLLEVHSNPAMTQIPFIFVTARATHEDIRHGMNLGADDYTSNHSHGCNCWKPCKSNWENIKHANRFTSKKCFNCKMH